MSLWFKNPSEMTFSDIDAFCRTMQPEGARLDYKGVSFPYDLAKTIAAFANTLAGLLILGVDADKTTNTPNWPPQKGYPIDIGLSERVGNIAQQAIYPPVRVMMSNVIENDHIPGHCLLVIRVDESREAPHSVDKRRKIYVYERTDNTNEPYELADIARIEQLIARRNRIVDQRESQLQANLTRGRNLLTQSITPIRWISASPVFPWCDNCAPQDCVAFHPHLMKEPWQMAYWRYQTFTGGSLARGLEAKSTIPGRCGCVSSVIANGTLFCMTYTDETLKDNKTLFHEEGPSREVSDKMWVNLRRTREMTRDFFSGMKQFYTAAKTKPGEVIITMGMSNANGVLMQDSNAGR